MTDQCCDWAGLQHEQFTRSKGPLDVLGGPQFLFQLAGNLDKLGTKAPQVGRPLISPPASFDRE